MNNILITGAAAGIGLATAELFASKGWSIGLIDIDETALKNIANRFSHQHVWYRALDVRDEAATAEAVKDFAAVHQHKLRLLFNCAGILRIGEFEKMPLKDHKLIFEINVQGVMNMSHAAFQFLKTTPNAQIINMSSASALYGTPHFASYSASKFAVRGLTEALNIEWKDHGISVVDIMPPFVNTGMVQSQTFQAPVLKRLGVNLKAEDVATTVWSSVGSNEVHHPVSLPFKTAMLINKLMPTRVTKELMLLLSR